jgi:hypothetical protein
MGRFILALLIVFAAEGCQCGQFVLNSACDAGTCPTPYFCDTSVSDAGFCVRTCDRANRGNECMLSGDQFEGACDRVAADGGGLCTSFCGTGSTSCPKGLTCGPSDGGFGPVCL